MIEKINLKNNKGISLASVIVTLILAMIILSSIIYSNNRTKEIQKAMLLNSDIEELTKKVEVYYLEKGTLPIVEDPSSPYKYIDGVTYDSNTPVYYKLEISSLENITLNNKEIISESLTEGNQWYVINKETHTIYFVKYINGNVVPQIAQYSNNYESITLGATADESNRIIYNYNDPAGGGNLIDTTITPGVDELLEDTTSIDLGIVNPETGQIQNGGDYTGVSPGPESGPDGITNVDGIYDSPYLYAGYKVGENKSIVLHYDGKFNTGTGSSISHSTSTDTWSDLSGNGLDGKLVSGNPTWKLAFKEAKGNTKFNDLIAGDYEDEFNSNADKVKVKFSIDRTKLLKDSSYNRTTSNINFGNNYVNLTSNSYILVDGFQFNSTNNYYIGNSLESIIPHGTDPYTMEVVFKYTPSTMTKDGSNNPVGGLIGIGAYPQYTFDETNKEYYNESSSKDEDKYFYKENRNLNRQTRRLTCKLAWTSLFTHTSIGEDSEHNFEDTNTNSNYDYLTKFINGRTIKDSSGKSKYIGVKGTANAFRVNGKGLRSYYWGNDTDTNSLEMETDKIYTATVRYDGNGTEIWVNGTLVSSDNNGIAPNTTLHEITIGATRRSTTANYYDDLGQYNEYRGLLSRQWVLSGYSESNNHFKYTFKYNEFLNSPIYSVRIYNDALSDNEIKHNYNIDAIRFGSGS